MAERTEGFYDIRMDVLPIVVVSRNDEPTRGSEPLIRRFAGTGFLVGKGLFVTCHHCVAAPVAEEDTYAVVTPAEFAPEYREMTGVTYFANHLTKVEQDASGLDLAIGRVGRDPLGLELADEGSRVEGEDVRTYGYPLTRELPHPQGEGKSLDMRGRVLKGYITANYMNDVPGYGPTPTEELDMMAPRGLSGAPIIRSFSNEVIGVLYGTRDTGTVEQLSRVDEETGLRTPEVQRVTTFAVSHWFDSLRNLRGALTEHMPLGEFLAK